MSILDFKESDENLYYRGNGIASRDIRIGRQDVVTKEDVVYLDVNLRKIKERCRSSKPR